MSIPSFVLIFSIFSVVIFFDPHLGHSACSRRAKGIIFHSVHQFDGLLSGLNLLNLFFPVIVF